MTTEKEAGALVYLQEELTDARMRCDQLKRLVDKAVRLIAKSTHRDHFYEVAGDIIYGLPDTLFRLDKALDATALAASRLDYEELKQQLRPEKVEELELALKDVRIRHLDRRSPNLQPQPVAPQPITPQNGKLAMLRLASTNFVSAALRGLADYIDDNPSPNRHVIIGGLHRVKMALSQTAQEAVEAMGPLQASSREDVMEGFKKANPSLSDEDLEQIADEWEKNKSVVKDKTAAGVVRFPEGQMTEQEWVGSFAESVEEYKENWLSFFNRTKFNRMDGPEQKEYEASLKRKAEKPRYRAWRKGADTFYEISKATFEWAKKQGIKVK